ncbi:MAG: TIGR01777 family oxidoreductase [Bacteroidia bacterium]|nr:TIGR01777 family oxidoreductase [Bacteroidia bacterium]
METVLIAGASGLIGKQLSFELQKKGYRVIHLNRNLQPNNPIQQYRWNIQENYIDDNAILEADYIINLAGEGIANKRWTDKQKQLIIESRVNATLLIKESLQRTHKKIKAYISASAIGFYGAINSETIFTEEAISSNDFLGTCCAQWESAAKEINPYAERTVIFRIGTVLSADGGALPKLVWPIKHNIGAAIGSGKQYMPWIHIDDVCALFLQAIEQNNIDGIYNAVAPEHISNYELNKEIAESLTKKLLPIKIPTSILKLVLGEMAVLVLNGSRVSSQKIMDAGFKFKYPDFKFAITELLAFRK